MASLATIAQLMERFDYRDIAALAQDAGQEIDIIALQTDTNVQAALDDASGAMLAALNVTERYSESDLTSLTGSSAKYLARICCEIALAYLWGRRPFYRIEDRKAAMEASEAHLERLRKGEHVLAIDANIDATTPSVDGPTTVQYQTLNLVRDRVQNFYPRRALPGNR